MEDFADKRTIELPGGKVLEIEMTKAFIKGLMGHFSLSNENELTDDMIRLYCYGSLKSAVDKLDNQESNE